MASATRRVGEVVVPLRRRELAGDDRGAGAGAIFEEFEEVAAILIAERAEAPVVEDEDVGAGEAGEEADVAAVGVGEREFLEEARDAAVEGAVALAARLLRERAGQVRLPGARSRR